MATCRVGARPRLGLAPARARVGLLARSRAGRRVARLGARDLPEERRLRPLYHVASDRGHAGCTDRLSRRAGRGPPLGQCRRGRNRRTAVQDYRPGLVGRALDRRLGDAAHGGRPERLDRAGMGRLRAGPLDQAGEPAVEAAVRLDRGRFLPEQRARHARQGLAVGQPDPSHRRRGIDTGCRRSILAEATYREALGTLAGGGT